jgi:hypothetical protein
MKVHELIELLQMHNNSDAEVLVRVANERGNPIVGCKNIRFIVKTMFSNSYKDDEIVLFGYKS